MNHMPEFRPPPSRSIGRVILGLVVLVAAVVPVVLVGPLIWGGARIVYVIGGGKLTVQTGGLLDRERSVPLRQIRAGRGVTLSGGSRTWGTALPGYCVGRFSYDEVGPVWQATGCGRRGVLLQLRDGRPWLLSPPDELDFLARLSAAEPTRLELPPPRSSAFARLMGPLMVLLLVFLVGVEALIVAGPGRMRYLVSGGRLEVRTMFGHRRWPAEQLRARRHHPQVKLRLAGAAMPGYYTGLFRADGTTTRIYATSLKDGVLLECPGRGGAERRRPARVFVSPAEIPEFLAALREEGATVSEEEPA
jgi:hypothetical protein